MEIKNSKRKLQKEVEALNVKYCKNGRNIIAIDESTNGYQVILTGKKDGRTKNKYLKGSLGKTMAFITYGHHPAETTLKYLKIVDEKGNVKTLVKSFDNKKR